MAANSTSYPKTEMKYLIPGPDILTSPLMSSMLRHSHSNSMAGCTVTIICTAGIRQLQRCTTSSRGAAPFNKTTDTITDMSTAPLATPVYCHVLTAMAPHLHPVIVLLLVEVTGYGKKQVIAHFTRVFLCSSDTFCYSCMLELVLIVASTIIMYD